GVSVLLVNVREAIMLGRTCLRFNTFRSCKRASLTKGRRTLAVALLSASLAVALAWLATQPAAAQVQGMLGGFMEISQVFFGEGSRTFGPGDVITVSGAVPFVPLAACPGAFKEDPRNPKGRGELQQGFVDPFPTADLYVIADT